MFDLEDNFMRILYWTPQFWPEIGGIPILAMKALPVLKEYGHDILVVTSRVGSGQPDRGEYKSIPIRRFRFWEALKKNDVSLILKITKQITELKKTYRPDVIHIDFSVLRLPYRGFSTWRSDQFKNRFRHNPSQTLPFCKLGNMCIFICIRKDSPSYT